MKKRVFAALLAVAILVTTVGCGSKEVTPNPDVVESSAVLLIRDPDTDTSEPDSSQPDGEEPSASSSLPSSSVAPSSSTPASSSQASSAPSSSVAPSSSTAPSSSVAASSSTAPSSSVAPSSSTPTSSSQASSTPSSSTASSSEESSSRTSSSLSANWQSSAKSVEPSGEYRAVWLSYLDFNTLLKYKTEKEFTANIKSAFAKMSVMGINTVIVQVRPFGDALYNSDYFAWSHTITGTEGEDPGFDPLEIICNLADNYDLNIEAWINPYRVRSSGYKDELDEDSLIYYWWYNEQPEVIEYNGGLYLNPASLTARNLIVNGVEEIVANYKISAIHFDDYFYPTTDAAFDAESYKEYKSSGGTKALADWRRENVDLLVKSVYSTIKNTNSRVKFGISPQGNMDNNYNKQYIDVKKWVTTKGYVDYICPQIYYGFDNETYPFAATVNEWNKMIKLDSVELIIGLAPYKIGTEDTWAGDGKTEWQNNNDMLKRMVYESRKYSHYKGFALFRYDSIFNPASSVKSRVETEIKNLKTLLK